MLFQWKVLQSPTVQTVRRSGLAEQAPRASHARDARPVVALSNSVILMLLSRQ
jgi:hypothetical protein